MNQSSRKTVGGLASSPTLPQLLLRQTVAGKNDERKWLVNFDMRNCCHLALILCTPYIHASADQSGRSMGHQFFTQRVSVGSHWLATKHLTAWKCAWKFRDRFANAPASNVWMYTDTHTHVQVYCKTVLAFITFHLTSFFPCMQKYRTFCLLFCFCRGQAVTWGTSPQLFQDLLAGHCWCKGSSCTE